MLCRSSTTRQALGKMYPRVAEGRAPFSDDEVLAAIREVKDSRADERPAKQVELQALLTAPEDLGDDVPVDPDFHARRLPDRAWRHSVRSDGIEAVIQLHRLREVLVPVGFTRFEAVTPDIQGEYETDVERAEIALDPAWFPAVENRGEGLFVQLRATAVMIWLARPAVKQRLDSLAMGYLHWAKERKSLRLLPGGPYVLLHTLSHLLIQSRACAAATLPARSASGSTRTQRPSNLASSFTQEAPTRRGPSAVSCSRRRTSRIISRRR